MVPLTTIRIDKIEPSNLSNYTVLDLSNYTVLDFYKFDKELPFPIGFVWQHSLAVEPFR
jgi:hypothetical protein